MERTLLKNEFIFVSDTEYAFMYIPDSNTSTTVALDRAQQSYPIRSYVCHEKYLLLFCDLPCKTVEYDLAKMYEYCIRTYLRTGTIEADILPINTCMTEQGFSILPRGTAVLNGDTYTVEEFTNSVINEIENEFGLKDPQLFHDIFKKIQKTY